MYQKLYKEIIDQAKAENRQKGQGTYYERHHIVPEFMFKNRSWKGPKGHLSGDPNNVDNLVLLTFKEHLMAHYYLYEIHKDTHYGYQSAAALQFFFTKAGNNHVRQRTLSEVDAAFLEEMRHLRELGIQGISKARKGKMPVVDAVTRQKIGSVPVDHPKVLSGEWVHHSKGKPGHRNGKSQKGSNNNNYKGMTESQKERALKCVLAAIVDDNHVIKGKFLRAIQEEFTEFKKVSHVWVNKYLGGIKAVVDTYNQKYGTVLQYDSYYRSSDTRSKISARSKSFGWVTDGTNSVRVSLDNLQKFLLDNPTFSQGRTL